MKNLFQKISYCFFYLLVLFICLLLLFSAFRYVFFKLNIDASQNIPSNLYSNAFSLGISFDMMVASYLLVLPAVAFFFAMFFNYNSLWFRRIITFYFSIVFFLVLLACCSDIPFYDFCGSRLSATIVMWTDTPGTMLNFVGENPTYYPYIIAFIAGIVVSIFFLLFLQKNILRNAFEEKYSVSKKIIVFISLTFMLLIGIRGGWRLRPIAIRDAFVTNYPFANLLPLNPVHSFFDSMEKINLNYLEDNVAINNVKRILNVHDNFDSPIARQISFSDSSIKPNIVIVMMESMSAEMTALASIGKSFTSNLDTIAKNSISFSRFYTSGMHTCNGIYGVLYSMPSVPGEHPLSNIYAVNEKFTGIANVLKENGYSTSFFCTHYEEFDNMGFFLRNNGFENFFSAKEYTSDLSEGTFGVSDETQYDFAFNKLSEFSKSNKPFFATILTISTHEPPILPKKTSFKPKSNIPFEQVYEYADWALGNFMKRCLQEKWYDNTIFVFVADHGCNMQSHYEIPLAYHHSPFIIYSPVLIKESKQIDKLAIQIDVFPTLMNFLKLPYTNNTLGINLFKEERPYVFFCKDYLVGCLDKKHFLIIRKFGGESMHDYANGKAENVLEENKALSDSMKTYTYSILQTSQWLLENNKLGKQ
ncbi:MAG: LTA synthase family protein [Bacteroidota bacterium]